jgi:hypothetical protein
MRDLGDMCFTADNSSAGTGGQDVPQPATSLPSAAAQFMPILIKNWTKNFLLLCGRS